MKNLSKKILSLSVILFTLYCINNIDAQSLNLIYVPTSGNTYNPSSPSSITTGADNNAIFGFDAAFNITTGNSNSFMGFETGYHNTSGSANTYLGYQAGFTNSTSSYNFSLGYKAGYYNTSDHNHFEGFQAGLNNSTGTLNTFIGYNSGYSNTTGSYDQFIGNEAGFTTGSGSYNQFDGFQAGYYNTSGSYNYFAGYQAGYSSQDDVDNTFIGYAAGYGSNGGSANTFTGYYTGSNNGAGTANSYYGDEAGQASSGSYNAMFGDDVGYSDLTGSELTLLGALSTVNNTSLTNSAAIGYGASVTNPNEMVFGNESVVQWGFGVDPASTHALQVGSSTSNGNGAYLSNTGVWNNASDVNKKENFVTLNDSEILSRVDNLAVTRWNYKGDDPSIQHIGPMAQDFYRTFHVGNDSVSISTIDPAGVALVSVKALHAQGKALQQQNVDLTSKVSSLASQNQVMQGQLLDINQSLASQQAQLDALTAGLEQIKEMQIQCCDLQQNQNGNNTGGISAPGDQPRLDQNTPNPFSQKTVIGYYLPSDITSAIISIRSLKGVTLQVFNINASGSGQITVNAGTLTPGTYEYDMIANDKLVDSKKMMITGQ